MRTVTGRPALQRSTVRARAGSARARLIVIAGSAVLLLGVGWALFFSTWFSIDEVRVEGVAVLRADDVLQAADVRTGTQLVRVDADAVAARVGALAPVDEVSVARSWPHTLVITVVERRPALAVPSTDGITLYDRAGVGYLEVVAVPAGVPVLDTPDADEHAVDGVLTVLAELPDQLRARLAGVRAQTADAIELELTDGVVVEWGSPEQSARKAEVLTALMKQPGRVYIVSAPEVPAIRQ